MKFKLAIVVAAIVCAALFALAVMRQWPRAIFHCEGFGCAGLGIVYLALAVLVVLVFVVAGAYLGPKPRWIGATFSGGIAAMALLATSWFIAKQNEARIAEAEAMHERICAEYPRLCPEKSAPLPPSQQ